MSNIKLNDSTKIKVINNTSGSLSFTDFEGMNYMFPRPNSYKHIELKKIKALYNDYSNTVEYGYIIFENKAIYDYLEVPKYISDKILSEKEVINLLQKDAETIKETMKDLPQNIKENIANKAKELKIDSLTKIKVIKEITGFDITDYGE